MLHNHIQLDGHFLDLLGLELLATTISHNRVQVHKPYSTVTLVLPIYIVVSGVV